MSYGPSEANKVALQMYSLFQPYQPEDKRLGHPLLKVLDAVGLMWNDLDIIIRDKVEPSGIIKPGYSTVMELLECPEEWLPWLAQFIGVPAPPKNPPLDRELIVGSKGFHRGTLESIQKAPLPYLTGKKTVQIFERYGISEGNKAWRLTVVTFESETGTNEALIKHAIEEVIPAGIILNYIVSPAWIYLDVPPKAAKYSSVPGKYATYKLLAKG